MARVSVEITHYNNPDGLGLALASCTLQSYKDFRIIVVDDSSDLRDFRTSQLLDAISSDSRIELIRNECNVGAATSRNIAWSAGEEIHVVLDCDDIMHPKRIERHLFAIDDASARAAPLSDYVIHVTAYRTFSKGSKITQILCPPESNAEIQRALYLYQPCAFGAMAIKSSQSAPFLDGLRSCIDYTFLCYNKDRTLFLSSNEPSTYVQINPNSLTRSSETRQLQLRMHETNIFYTWNKFLSLTHQEAATIRQICVFHDQPINIDIASSLLLKLEAFLQIAQTETIGLVDFLGAVRLVVLKINEFMNYGK
jgi:glycosyltransferase involved in cell wall biosynthesis